MTNTVLLTMPSSQVMRSRYIDSAHEWGLEAQCDPTFWLDLR
jgi:hypothetical protein